MAAEKLRIDIVADSRAAVAGINQVKLTIDELKDKVKYYQDLAFAEKDVSKVRKYNSEIQILQASLKQTSNIGKVGFDEMGVAIAKTGSGIGHAFEGVRKLAYILPGIGMAGLFNLAFEGIVQAAEALDLFHKKLSILNQVSQDYDKTLNSNNQKAAEEATNLRVLEAVATDTSKAYSVRLAAVNTLQERYPAYLGNLSKEAIMSGQAADAINSVSDALYKKAIAEAASSRAADSAKNLLDLKKEENKLLEQENDIREKLKTAKSGREGATGGSTLGVGGGMEVDAYDQLIGKLHKVKNAIEDNRNSQLSFGRDIKSYTDEAVKLYDGYINLETKAAKVGKEAKEPKEKFLKHTKFKLQELLSPYDEDQLKILEETKVKLSRIKEIADKLAADQKRERIKNFFNLPTKLDPQKKSGALSEYEDNENKKLYERLTTMAKIKSEQNEWNAATAKQIELAQQVGNSLGRAFQAMLTAKNPFEALTNAVKQLVIDLAAAVAKMLIIRAIMAIINPGAAIGQVVGQAIAGTMPGFASGGTVSGPTSGYPVLLHGTEHIVRPDQMNKIIGGAAQMGSMMGGGGNTMNGEFVLRGQDLVLATQRANYSLNLRR